MSTNAATNNIAYAVIAIFALLAISSIATTLPVFATVTNALG